MVQQDHPDGSAPIAAPQEMVLSILGFALDLNAEDGGARTISSKAFITVLSRLGITEASTRATLNRMTHRGLLTHQRNGRSTAFGLTTEGERLVMQGKRRLSTAAPFERPDDIWTVLSCPMPARLRNARYHLQARLAWAGFGLLQPNLWIAPGRVDVEPLLVDLLPTEDLDLAHAFQGSPTFPAPLDSLVARAWDLDALRATHDHFLLHWESADPDRAGALPQLLKLISDWGDLLRTDPGLPGKYLGPHWPAHRSTRTFQRLHNELRPLVDKQYDSLT